MSNNGKTNHNRQNSKNQLIKPKQNNKTFSKKPKNNPKKTTKNTIKYNTPQQAN